MHSTDAHCFSCGYDTDLMIGSLMSNHQAYSAGAAQASSASLGARTATLAEMGITFHHNGKTGWGAGG
ncbi:hypothetical protein [Mesorhizobium sp. ANAO-SY3R2]|uniref:hypothetical protein n=1 Tax=Mesorhizobium sp. ANAO-SY3R2 TaxID=3166644 RepID=UPI00366A9DC7